MRIYANLITAIESNRKYLVFVYNAFELMELKLVLSFLPGVALGHRYTKASNLKALHSNGLTSRHLSCGESNSQALSPSKNYGRPKR